MAKDILKFHAVIWPALCLAAELEPPRRMVIHGYLLMGEKKMSKSLGNVLDPFAVIERFGADALRFYLFREVSFGQDGSISTAGFEQRYETELANDYGNLASRVLAMVDRYRDGTVPAAQVDAPLAEDFEGAVARFSELLDRAELTQALDLVWVLVRRLNRYVEETQPWVLAKDEADPERLDEVLYNLVEGLRVTTLLLVPYLPQTSETLLAALGEDGRALAELGSRAGRPAGRAGAAALPEDRVARLMAAPVLAVSGTAQALREPGGAGRRRPRGGGGAAGRPARPQRRRQVDPDEDRLRPGPAQRRPGRGAGTAGRLAAGARRARLPGRALPLPGLVHAPTSCCASTSGWSAPPAARRSGASCSIWSTSATPPASGSRRCRRGCSSGSAIAQALIGSPRLLLLDEPTSALDPVGRRIVRELLEELRRREVAVLLNSHLLSEVELVCDHVAIIAGGRLVKAGTPGGAGGAGGGRGRDRLRA